jgi:GT2 family glycosyltransferase
MNISVLIPTLGREKELIETIACLERQSVLPDEIIVVDQNQPELPGLTEALRKVSRAKHLRFQTKGVCLNYNRALAAAQGDVVLFVDDDVTMGPDLIKAHLSNYERDPDLGGVMGRVEQPRGDLPPDEIREVGAFHPLSGRVVGNFNATERGEVSVVQGVNMSFRRDVLMSADGFDLGFVGNGYFFEADIGLRVRASGKKIVFDPQAVLTHHMAQAGGTRVKNKAVHTHFFVRNGLRLVRRHSPRAVLPLITLRLGGYVAAKAAYNLDPEILSQGLKAIWEGWRDSTDLIGVSSEAQKKQT